MQQKLINVTELRKCAQFDLFQVLLPRPAYGTFGETMDTFSCYFFHCFAHGIIDEDLLEKRKVSPAERLFKKCTYHEHGDQTDDDEC